MYHSLRIALAEIVLVALLSTQIFGIGLISAEGEVAPELALPVVEEIISVPPPVEALPEAIPPVEEPIVEEIFSGSSNTGEITPPTEESISGSTDTPPTDTPSAEIGSTDTGALAGSGTIGEVSTETGAILEVSTGETLSGAIVTESGSIDTTTGALLSEKEVIPTQVREEQRQESSPENEILIQFRESNVDLGTYAGNYQLERIEETHNLTTTETITENNIAVVSVQSVSPDATSSKSLSVLTESTPISEFAALKADTGAVDAMIAELQKDPRIKHVQRNFVYTLQSEPREIIREKPKFTPMAFTGRSVPNDGDFLNLWGLDNQGQTIEGVSGEIDADIDYPEAIAYSQGRLSGEVIVAVLDTGIAYNHPDLASQMWDGSSCLSDTGAQVAGGCIHGYDFGDDDHDPTDSDAYRGHGTHVAGIIGAIQNNGTGSVGVSPKVKLMAVKIFGTKSTATTSSVIRGINFAKYNGAKVINASFGGGGVTPTRTSGFDFLSYEAIQDFPGLFIAAAGNDSSNSDLGRFYPSGFGTDLTVSGEVLVSGEYLLSGEEYYPGLQNVIAVAASDNTDTLASFSNYGTGTVHIAAPGERIYSTFPTVSSELDLMSTGSWSVYNASHSGMFVRNGEPGNLESDDFLVFDDLRNTISGEGVYASGSDTYIERVFTSSGKTNATMGIVPIWCDTPGEYNTWTDYMTIEYDTGNGYILDKKINELSLWGQAELIFGSFYSGTGKTINGKEGTYGYVGIQQFSTPGSTFKIRFGWHTDNVDDRDSMTGQFHGGCRILSGFYVERKDDGESGGYEYHPGTSMAAPHVAGAAALAWSFKSDAHMYDIRNAILGTTDYKPSLEGKVMTSGRLNVLNMLQALETPQIVNQKYTLSGESGVRFEIEGNLEDNIPYVQISNNSGFISDHVGIPYAELLAEIGIINAHASIDDYNLWNYITRAEVAKVASNIGGYNPTVCRGNVFSDVDSSLGDLCGYIEALADAGFISTGSTLYEPNIYMSRGEIVKIFLQVMFESPSNNRLHEYVDVTGTGIIEGYINRAYEIGCLGSDRDFSPYPNIFLPDAGEDRGRTFSLATCIMGFAPYFNTSNQERVYSAIYTSSPTSKTHEYYINGLSPDKTYYYRAYGCTVVYCSEMTQTYSFHTPKVASSNLGSTVTSTGSLYLSGATATGMTFSGSTASGHIILIDTGSTVTVDLPTRNLSIHASNPWDGVLEAPYVHTGALTITVSGSTLPVASIHHIGSDISPLLLSGEVATISIHTTHPAGSNLTVYRADGVGLPYTQIGTCIVSSSLCTFTTSHFSLFALGNPVSSSSGGGSSSGGSSGGRTTVGPGGGSSSSYSIFSPVSLVMREVSKPKDTPRSIVKPASSVSRNSIFSESFIAPKGSPSSLAKVLLVDPFVAFVEAQPLEYKQTMLYDTMIKKIDTDIKMTKNKEKKKILQSAKSEFQKIRKSVAQFEL